MIITPAILTNNFEAFAKQIKRAEKVFSYVQVDVMDGKFVPNTSFQNLDRIGELNTPLKFELHLMVNDPVAEMRRWQTIENVFRVLIQLESPTDVLRSISFAKKEGWEIGLVINPETPLSAAEPYLKQIDVLQFMTVHPGTQGAPVVPDVLNKIREFTHLPSPARGGGGRRPLCAVDGAINKDNIRELADLGVDIFNVGSYFTKAPSLKIAYDELRSLIKN